LRPFFSNVEAGFLEILNKIIFCHVLDILEELFDRKKYAIMSIYPYKIMAIYGGGEVEDGEINFHRRYRSSLA
jgi:hypothetical protein